MEVEIIIRDADRQVRLQHRADAMHPTQVKLPADEPLSDGTYNLFAITYQPAVSRVPLRFNR
jgi:hypothetical protein